MKDVERHSLSVRLEHWMHMVTTLILIYSGWRILGTTKSSMNPVYTNAVELHYYATYVFVFVIAYHLFFHGIRGDRAIVPYNFVRELKGTVDFVKVELGLKSKWPPLEKYASSQKFTYLGVFILSALLVFTGMIKAFAKITTISPRIIYYATLLHDLGMYLMIVFLLVHVLLIALRFREMLLSMVTGKVPLKYVEEKHKIWFEEIMREKKLREVIWHREKEKKEEIIKKKKSTKKL